MLSDTVLPLNKWHIPIPQREPSLQTALRSNAANVLNEMLN